MPDMFDMIELIILSDKGYNGSNRLVLIHSRIRTSTPAETLFCSWVKRYLSDGLPSRILSSGAIFLLNRG